MDKEVAENKDINLYHYFFIKGDKEHLDKTHVSVSFLIETLEEIKKELGPDALVIDMYEDGHLKVINREQYLKVKEKKIKNFEKSYYKEDAERVKAEFLREKEFLLKTEEEKKKNCL